MLGNALSKIGAAGKSHSYAKASSKKVTNSPNQMAKDAERSQ
jgi:hypothetical protein